MGNGPRLTIDIETSPLSVDDIEKAAAAAVANFGRPHIIMMGGGLISPWHAHPEYAGTPWADRDRLTKREHTVARVHILLFKLGVLKRISEDEFEDIKNRSVKRLKRSRWAQQQRKKVQSSP